jgi:hypothetical protein
MMTDNRKKGLKKKDCGPEPVCLEKKKRGRKKKFETGVSCDSKLDGCTFDDSEESKVESNPPIVDNNNYEKESVLFGDLNITIRTNKDAIGINPVRKSFGPEHFFQKTTKIDTLESDDEDREYLKNNTHLLENYHESTSEGVALRKTDNLCFNCCHSFQNLMFKLPIDFDLKLNRYKLYGIFCSPNCAKRFALDDITLHSKVHILGQFCRYMYNDMSYKIKPSPSRYQLKCFGGSLSITEFRKNFSNYLPYKLHTVPTKVIYIHT